MEVKFLMCFVLSLMAKVPASVGYIMTCPQLDEYSEDCDENMAWICDVITWRNKLANWKWSVEKKCSVSDAEWYWRSAFRCPDFSEVRCEDRSRRHTEKDLFNCPITFCVDGRYKDEKVLRRIWRRHMIDHKKLMTVYTNKLGDCRPSDCPRPTSSQGMNDHYTTYSPYDDPTTRETTTAYSPYYDRPTTVPTEECKERITPQTAQRGHFFDDCKTSPTGGCFWADIRESWSVDYYEAERICAAYDSVLAVISDENTYNIITAGVGNLTSYAALWLGMSINPMTKEVCPLGSCTIYWYSTAPYANPEDTKLSIIVSPSSGSYEYEGGLIVFEGLINYNPNTGTYGAVCWKPHKYSSYINPSTTPSYTTTERTTGTTAITCNERITPQTVQRGPFFEECKTSPTGGCFWANITDSWSVKYYEAERICAAYDSVLAVISDENTYNIIRNGVANITHSFVDLWLGMSINPNTKEVCPHGSFANNWYSTAPWSFYLGTKISISVDPSPGSYEYDDGRVIVFEGYQNGDPDSGNHGAVCWKPDKYSSYAYPRPTESYTSMEPATATNAITCNERITPQTMQRGPFFDECKTSPTGGCFWANITTSWSVNYTEAEQICASYDSILAIIPDENTYNIIRTGVANMTSYASLWLGMSINLITKEVCPHGSFASYWWSTAPYTGPMMTKISITINPTSESYEYDDGRVIVFEGYQNRHPNERTYGAVCWKPEKYPSSVEPSPAPSYTTTESATETAAITCNKTITNQTVQRGPVSENCTADSSGGCFWFDIREPWSVNFSEAESICSTNQSVLAVISDEDTYQEIMAAIKNSTSHAQLWLGMTINPATKELCPSGSFDKYWYSTGPYDSSSSTNVVLIADSSSTSSYEGIIFEGYINYSPQVETYGAVCWKPSQSHYNGLYRLAFHSWAPTNTGFCTSGAQEGSGSPNYPYLGNQIALQMFVEVPFIRIKRKMTTINDGRRIAMRNGGIVRPHGVDQFGSWCIEANDVNDNRFEDPYSYPYHVNFYDDTNDDVYCEDYDIDAYDCITNDAYDDIFDYASGVIYDDDNDDLNDDDAYEDHEDDGNIYDADDQDDGNLYDVDDQDDGNLYDVDDQDDANLYDVDDQNDSNLNDGDEDNQDDGNHVDAYEDNQDDGNLYDGDDVHDDNHDDAYEDHRDDDNMYDKYIQDFYDDNIREVYDYLYDDHDDTNNDAAYEEYEDGGNIPNYEDMYDDHYNDKDINYDDIYYDNPFDDYTDET